MAALTFIQSHLTTAKEKEESAQLFNALDVNQDGILTKQEILDGYKAYTGKDITSKHVDEMFQRIDLDNSGHIDFTEFCMASLDMDTLITPEKLRIVFDHIDTDKSGALSHNEIKEVLCFDVSFDPKEVDRAIQKIDKNNDGEIDF